MPHEQAATEPAAAGQVDHDLGPAPERAVAVVTECEACFTPDVCQLRGTCDHYRAELLRIAARCPQSLRPSPSQGSNV